MSMFGLFWLLGAASVKQAAVFFTWPFILLNLAQGIILFIYIVLISARKEWKDFLFPNNKRKDKFSSTSKKSKVSNNIAKSNFATKNTCLTYANAESLKDAQACNKFSENSFEMEDIAIPIGFSLESGPVEESTTSIPLPEIECKKE